MNLSIRETEALDALCDAFVPSLAFEKDEDPALFSMSARDLGVAALVAEALERIEPAKRDAFRLFLKLLEINQKASAPRIPLSKPGPETEIECDVCVVGSGAAGSVVAAELAANGQNVIVVEAGSGLSAGDFDQHELIGMHRLFREAGLSGTRDLSVSILAGTGLGGGTTVNWQSCFRTPDDVREEWAELSGCSFFTGDSFTESLDAVWGRIGASTDESEAVHRAKAPADGRQSNGRRGSLR